MNIIVLSGNLVSDAKEFKTQSDRRFFTFTIANNQVHYNKDKTKIEKTIFIDCIVSRDGLLKYTELYAKKGTMTTLCGAVDFKETEKDGTKYKNFRVIIEDLHFSHNGKTIEKDNIDPGHFDDMPF
jgi:single-stranded DNA-binding protein